MPILRAVCRSRMRARIPVCALATAQQMGVPLFAISASHTPYEIAEANGLGDADYAALSRLWEDWAQYHFQRS